MIIEDYVSFEIAKLLKEKGFNEPCLKEYYNDGVLSDITIKAKYNTIANQISAPTLQMTMKWLREVHNIAIEPWCCDYKWQCSFWILPKGVDIYTSFEGKEYNSYEEAVEAAIIYCLENLI